jgi:hypothetical protein
MMPADRSNHPQIMPVQFKRFDVRMLLNEGTEPFPEIRRRIDLLNLGEGISIIAPFLPAPLIENLRGEGFQSRVEPQSDGSWIAYFLRGKTAVPTL